MPKGDCALKKSSGWSGWPGAYCLTCGRDDPMEEAIADGAYDPVTGTWEPDTRESYDFICPLDESRA